MNDVIDLLAKEMNLSARTIYRALRNQESEARPSVARRAEDIRRRAVALGYRTNVAARSIREGNFKQMLFITAQFDHGCAPVLSNYVTVLSELLLQRGCRLLLEELLIDRRTGKAHSSHKLFSERSADGIFVVISSGHFPAEMESALSELGLPLVWVNYQPSLPDACSVISDESAAIADMCHHLAHLGHRKIAFLTLDYGHYSARHRREEMARSAAAAGLELTVISTNESVVESSIRKTVNLFFDRDYAECTAAVCYNAVFMTVLRLEAAKRAIAVPSQLSICHFISIDELQRQREFPLSGVMLPEEQMANEALRRMDRMGAGHPCGGAPIPVSASFVEGESTAPPAVR